MTIVAWRLGYFDLRQKERVLELVRVTRGVWWAMPLYVLAYALVVVFCLPATAFTILGGALFGAVVGAPLAWTGAVLGTAVAHIIARTIGKGPVNRLFGKHRLLRKLKNRADLFMLIRMRVLPVAPFGVLDYASGIAGVSLRALLVATAIGIVPGVCAYAFVGHSLVSSLGGGQEERNALWIAGVVTVAMASLSIVPGIVQYFRAD